MFCICTLSNGLIPIVSGGEVSMTISYVDRVWAGEGVTSTVVTAPEPVRHFPSFVGGEHWYAICGDQTESNRISIPSKCTVNHSQTAFPVCFLYALGVCPMYLLNTLEK